jgi:hypothetical protein
MYEIRSETIIDADLAAVWALVTDVANWPSWDPHERAARLDGPFAVGTTGWSKPHGGPGTTWVLTEVVEQRRWSSECPLPGGKLAGTTVYEPLADGKLRCAKTIRVSGPLVPLFRLYFGRRIRADLARTWAALEAAAA